MALICIAAVLESCVVGRSVREYINPASVSPCPLQTVRLAPPLLDVIRLSQFYSTFNRSTMDEKFVTLNFTNVDLKRILILQPKKNQSGYNFPVVYDHPEFGICRLHIETPLLDIVFGLTSYKGDAKQKYTSYSIVAKAPLPSEGATENFAEQRTLQEHFAVFLKSLDAILFERLNAMRETWFKRADGQPISEVSLQDRINPCLKTPSVTEQNEAGQTVQKSLNGREQFRIKVQSDKKGEGK